MSELGASLIRGLWNEYNIELAVRGIKWLGLFIALTMFSTGFIGTIVLVVLSFAFTFAINRVLFNLDVNTLRGMGYSAVAIGMIIALISIGLAVDTFLGGWYTIAYAATFFLGLLGWKLYTNWPLLMSVVGGLELMLYGQTIYGRYDEKSRDLLDNQLRSVEEKLKNSNS